MNVLRNTLFTTSFVLSLILQLFELMYDEIKRQYQSIKWIEINFYFILNRIIAVHDVGVDVYNCKRDITRAAICYIVGPYKEGHVT